MISKLLRLSKAARSIYYFLDQHAEQISFQCDDEGRRIMVIRDLKDEIVMAVQTNNIEYKKRCGIFIVFHPFRYRCTPYESKILSIKTAQIQTEKFAAGLKKADLKLIKK